MTPHVLDKVTNAQNQVVSTYQPQPWLQATSPGTAAQVTQLADLHARVRGFGHVKVRNLAGVKRAERELALQLGIDAATSAAVQHALDDMKGAGMLKGIPVVVAK